MRNFTKSTQALFTAIMLLVTLSVLWLVAVPNGMAPASFLLVGLLLAGFVAIARLNYDNSQDTGSLAKMLHQTNGVPVVVKPSPRSDRGHGRRS